MPDGFQDAPPGVTSPDNSPVPDLGALRLSASWMALLVSCTICQKMFQDAD